MHPLRYTYTRRPDIRAIPINGDAGSMNSFDSSAAGDGVIQEWTYSGLVPRPALASARHGPRSVRPGHSDRPRRETSSTTFTVAARGFRGNPRRPPQVPV